MINPTTLYYTFSTIPQVLVALVGLLATYVYFRISGLQDYLVGDGQAALNRKGDVGYILPDYQWSRLKDAISRKNIYEIKAVLKKLRDKEKEEGFTKETNSRPMGLQVMYEDRFGGTLREIKELKELTLITTFIGAITIILSLVSLSLVDIISICICYSLISLIINITLTIITLILSLVVIFKGLNDKTRHETDRDND